jgi:hypothetical protein
MRFTTFDRAKITAVLICFPMPCHSVGYGIASQRQSATQLTTQSIAVDHVGPSSAFTMWLAT